MRSSRCRSSGRLAAAVAVALLAVAPAADAERLTGTPGPDRLVGTKRADIIKGGGGRDLLRANDGRGDTLVDGGPGRDTCIVDRRDRRIRSCERTLVRRAPLPALTRSAGGAGAAHAFGKWAPGRFDTCPKALHDRYATLGRDGRLYPGWHPPALTNPATGRRCRFGHEHGRDPRRSDLYRWVASHLGGGIPFGAANEALDRFAAANPGAARRHEDHVGHKIEWQNDVRLQRSPSRRRIGVTCDFLTKVHQGTHSGDAFANNLHELIYAARCSDGTALLVTELAAFGAANGFTRACGGRIPAGRGARLIPDRSCAGLYEDWISSNRIVTRRGRELAYFDPHFAVFNPARVYDRAKPGSLGRPIDACWERGAKGGACDVATANGTRRTPLAFDDPRSPFDGAQRETYFNQTTVRNARGPSRWYTDPYGGRAGTRRFAGALCQLVSRTDNSDLPTLESQSFGAERPYGGRGVHAPN